MTNFFLHEQRYRDLGPAADRAVVICGAGALGANLAETLGRMGLRRLRVIDRDRIEAHNLSTQPWLQQDVGAPKARVLASALYRAVGARVEPRHVELTPANAATLLTGGAVVVDAFDNLPARHAVAEAALGLGIPCLHIALGGAGDYGCGLWDGAYFPTTGTNDKVTRRQGDKVTESSDDRPPTTDHRPPTTDRTEEGGSKIEDGSLDADHERSSILDPRSSTPDGCDYPLTRPLALLVAAAGAEAIIRYLLGGERVGFDVTLRDLTLRSC